MNKTNIYYCYLILDFQFDQPRCAGVDTDTTVPLLRMNNVAIDR